MVFASFSTVLRVALLTRISFLAKAYLKLKLVRTGIYLVCLLHKQLKVSLISGCMYTLWTSPVAPLSMCSTWETLLSPPHVHANSLLRVVVRKISIRANNQIRKWVTGRQMKTTMRCLSNSMRPKRAGRVVKRGGNEVLRRMLRAALMVETCRIS